MYCVSWQYIVKWVRKPTRCNNQMFIINTVSTCFGHHYADLQENKDRVLLHVVCWAVTGEEKVDISCNVFFVGQCLVNLDGTLCVYANVECKWVCRSVGPVSASYVFQVWCIGSGCSDVCVVPVWWEGCVVQVLLGAVGAFFMFNNFFWTIMPFMR